MITQTEVAEAIDRSGRWYQDLEAGRGGRLAREQCLAISDLFLLAHDEVRALMLCNMGGVARPEGPDLDAPTLRSLQHVLDQQPHPAWLLGPTWDVLAYNSILAEWFPWATEHDANLMRWGLGAGQQALLDWEEQARAYLAMLRFTSIQYPHDLGVRAIINDVVGTDAYLVGLWNGEADVTEGGGPLRYRVRLEANGGQPALLECTTLFSAAAPSCRLVILVPIGEDGLGEGGHLRAA
ncbi:hypothetical protein ACGH2B_24905 [Streptomyces sp. BBFR2]|uniref:MmyB family transcriptional regulator n=1 Tax=Streptomyces sp. BBFR2 TaxID=3372854 RepID=UPI0037D99526